MKRLFVLLFLASLLLTANIALTVAQDTTDKDTETYLIVYDEAHEQYFTRDLMSTALASLNDSLDTANLDVTVSVVPQTEQFNRTNLQGSDLVIVSNPGTDEEGALAEVGDTEAASLRNFMRIGGSVLYMSNPFSLDQNITGHAAPLNDLIFTQFEVAIDTEEVDDDDNTTIIVDDLNNVGHDAHIKINLGNIEPSVLVTETQNLTESETPYVVYYGARIIEDSNIPGDVTGNTSDYAYLVDRNYEVELLQRSPRWLYGTDFDGDQGRAILVGSTIMFSDLPFNENTKWIDQGENLGFFQNIVAWLLDITPIPEAQPIVTEPFDFFVTTNLAATLIIGLGFIAVSFIYFIYRGRMQAKDIFDVFEEKKTTSKTQGKKSTKSKQKSSSQSRRKRRRRT